ncbi:hypothetical protein B0H10DRAFT_2196012 [Mycena sp. CBHHK59/15]|nr:hypothetical protein B0H10DRAFT_2196012 [Mycena sp. CBHHK59/15]
MNKPKVIQREHRIVCNAENTRKYRREPPRAEFSNRPGVHGGRAAPASRSDVPAGAAARVRRAAFTRFASGEDVRQGDGNGRGARVWVWVLMDRQGYSPRPDTTRGCGAVSCAPRWLEEPSQVYGRPGLVGGHLARVGGYPACVGAPDRSVQAARPSIQDTHASSRGVTCTHRFSMTRSALDEHAIAPVFFLSHRDTCADVGVGDIAPTAWRITRWPANTARRSALLDDAARWPGRWGPAGAGGRGSDTGGQMDPGTDGVGGEGGGRQERRGVDGRKARGRALEGAAQGGVCIVSARGAWRLEDARYQDAPWTTSRVDPRARQSPPHARRSSPFPSLFPPRAVFCVLDRMAVCRTMARHRAQDRRTCVCAGGDEGDADDASDIAIED